MTNITTCVMTGKQCLCVCLCCSGMCNNKPQPHPLSPTHNKPMVRCQFGTRIESHTYVAPPKREAKPT